MLVGKAPTPGSSRQASPEPRKPSSASSDGEKERVVAAAVAEAASLKQEVEVEEGVDGAPSNGHAATDSALQTAKPDAGNEPKPSVREVGSRKQTRASSKVKEESIAADDKARASTGEAGGDQGDGQADGEWLGSEEEEEEDDEETLAAEEALAQREGGRRGHAEAGACCLFFY
jgi:hypothetical protein